MVRRFFWRTTWRLSDWVAAFFCVFLIVQNAAWWFVDVRDYIDVQRIGIAPSMQGDPIRMDVARVVRRDFVGGYNVSIREAHNGQFCTTGNVDLEYEASAKLRDPLYLSYWAGGGSCQGRIPSEMKPGLHSMRTCHFVDAPWFILARKERCLNTIFEILPRS